jgi:hypothetical protein
MVQDIEAVSERRRVPETIRSCHTAVVGGYLVEGHVPAAVVQRLRPLLPAPPLVNAYAPAERMTADIFVRLAL